MTVAAPTHRHLPVLDGARGIAALAVFGYHIAPYFGGLPWLQGSFLAVDLFFILSGFVIALSYEARLREGRLGFGRFVWVRVVRLYPLYLVACVIGLAYFAIKWVSGLPDAPTPFELMAALPGTALMLPSPMTSTWGFTPFPFAPSAWSLSLEFWFNIVYALVVIRFGLAALWVLAAAALVVLVQQALAFGSIDMGWNIATMIGGSARFWFSFTIGVILFRLHRSDWRVPPATILLGLAVFGFVAVPADAIAVGMVWVVVVFPAAVLIGAAVEVGPRMTAVCDHLGRLSYGIYILHAPLVLFETGVFKVLLGAAWADHQAMIGGVIVVTVIGFAAVATYGFDEPLRRYLQGRRPGVIRPGITPAR
jgi:peptidoglycan/LPS O-acetylase OafA/YrhL